MREDLLRYYQDELTYLRQAGAQFARDYPNVAGKIALEQDDCKDPHVERLLEGFAFLAARVRKKIDDQFPEITEALLNVVYPHFLRPVPSLTIVEFQVDPGQGRLSTGLRIERAAILESRPVNGERCKFRTVYPVTLWPVTVANATWSLPDAAGIRAADAVAAIRLQLDCAADLRFSQLEIDTLSFHLNGEPRLIHKLYEVLCSRLRRIVVRTVDDRGAVDAASAFELPATALRPMGFGEDEGALPYPGRSFLGYRHLQEYCAFPEKFFFIEIGGLRQALSGFGRRAEIVFLISNFEGGEGRETLRKGVDAGTFRLGCTPIVNLFPHTAETILVDQRHYEYPVIPDIRRPESLEIFSVDEVTGISPQTRETVRYEPFYAFRHNEDPRQQQTFWIAHRRDPQDTNRPGVNMAISLLDLSMNPVAPDADSIEVRVTCSNRDLPFRLPFRIGEESLGDGDRGDLQLEGGTAVRRVIMLTKPTPARRLPIGSEAQWRLISHLAFSHLSLVDDGGEALKQMLSLYNFEGGSGGNSMEQRIAGLTRLKSSAEYASIATESGVAFARGTRIEIEFDEDQFVGEGVYLFASVLENFLGLYASLNSFTRLRATTKQRKESLYEWPPRAGQRILL